MKVPSVSFGNGLRRAHVLRSILSAILSFMNYLIPLSAENLFIVWPSLRNYDICVTCISFNVRVHYLVGLSFWERLLYAKNM